MDTCKTVTGVITHMYDPYTKSAACGYKKVTPIIDRDRTYNEINCSQCRNIIKGSDWKAINKDKKRYGLMECKHRFKIIIQDRKRFVACAICAESYEVIE